MSAPELTTLKPWLIQQRTDFLSAYEAKDLKGWVVCMGNASGDTDTLVSSISYAFLASAIPSSDTSAIRYIPLLLTPSTSFNLRPENLRVLTFASLEPDSPSTDLLCCDALGGLNALNLLTEYGAKFALVDHNELLPYFGAGEVITVIDHHDPAQNNTLYKDAKPRVIQVPTGSCASLVAVYFSTTLPNNTPVPPEIADFLLSAILIDTGNLKSIEKGGKATATDVTATEYLTKFSSFAAKGSSVAGPTPEENKAALGKVFDELIALKLDVGRLSSAELLERDSKDYLSPNGWKYALSTVPMGLVEWTAREGAERGGGFEGLLASLEAFMAKNDLDAAGILTSFNRPPSLLKRKGSHAREIVFLVKDAALEPLFDGLAKAKVLDLKKWKEGNVDAFEALAAPRKGKVWRMGNEKATRKQVGPALEVLVAGLSKKE